MDIVQKPGLKPNNIGMRLDTKKKEISNVIPSHSNVPMKEEIANALMVSYITVRKTPVFKLLCNIVQYIEILL